MPKRKKTKKTANKARELFLISLASAVFLLVSSVWIFSQSSKEEIACTTEDFTGMIDGGERIAKFEGMELFVPDSVLARGQDAPVLGTVSGEEKWIEVDLSEQKLYAREGTKIVLETPVSTGLPWWPTPTGEFRIWIKLRATKMEGGEGRNYYYLPNVPYVMFFENEQVPGRLGYGLHGTYWHNDFGRPRSHGCVNLPTPMAEKLYYWAEPALPEGKYWARSSQNNPGTRIVIHE